MSKRKRKSKRSFENTNLPDILPLNNKQGEYIKALYSSPQTIVFGPSGCGKTYVSAAVAATAYRKHQVNKIILTRPNVASGRSIGFFPGSLEEKMMPWVAPYIKVFEIYMGRGALETGIRNNNIEIIPFETMRGSSWENSFVLLDEAQNTTKEEMKMFLTRIGEYSSVVINGDIQQSDLKTTSGLSLCLNLIKKYKIPASIIEFGVDDIVRSDLCAEWVKAFLQEGI